MRFLSTFGQLPGTPLNLVVIVLWGMTEGLGLVLFVPLLALLTNGDSTNVDPPFNYIIDAFEFASVPPTLNAMLIVISILILGSIALGYCQRYMLVRSKQMYTFRARRSLMENLYFASWHHISSQSHGNIINQLVTECHRASNALQFELLGVAAAIQVTIFMVLSAFLSWQLMLITVAFGFLTFAVARPLQRRAKVLGEQTNQANYDLNFYGVDFLRGSKLVKVTATEDVIVGRLGQYIKELFNVSFGSELNAAQLYFVVQALPVVLLAGLIAFSVHVLELGAPIILVFLIFLARLAPKVAHLQQQTRGYSVTSPAIRLIKEMLDTSSAAREVTGPSSKPFQRLEHGIGLDKVCYTYPSGDGPALNDVSLSIGRNQIVAIVGKSGAGKSTLIDLLAGLRRPVAGRIDVDRVDLTELDLRSWRHQIGYVTQEVIVFNDTVRNNITFAHSDSTAEDIERAMALAHFAEVLDSLPDGLDTVLGEGGVRLSGGQKQRLALTRALIGNPQLLLLDEATSALDNESERLIQHAIESIAQTVTVVVIAHRLSTVIKADVIYVMERGCVVEQGTYEELVREGGRFAELHKLQFA